MSSILTTLSAVKDEMKITTSSDDSYLNRQIKVYSDMFQSLVGRDLHMETDISESISVNRGRRRLILRRTPIDSINEIKNPDDETIDQDDYFLEDPDAGFVAKEDGSWQHTEAGVSNIRQKPEGQALREYTVDYHGGWVTPEQEANDPSLTRDLPYDIEDAVIVAIVSGYTQRGVDSAITSISVGDGSTSLGSDSYSEVMGRRVPKYFEAIAKRYKSVSIA